MKKKYPIFAAAPCFFSLWIFSSHHFVFGLLNTERVRKSEQKKRKKTRRRQKRSLMKLPIIEQNREHKMHVRCRYCMLFFMLSCVKFSFSVSDCLSLFFLCTEESHWVRTLHCGKCVNAKGPSCAPRDQHCAEIFKTGRHTVANRCCLQENVKRTCACRVNRRTRISSRIHNNLCNR